MNQQIEEIIETLNEGDEVTLVLKNGVQMTGLFRGFDDENVILRAKSGNTPDLGWNIEAIEDIVTQSEEPAGDIVKIAFTDIATGRQVVINFDATGETATVNAEFVPSARRDESGWYIHLAMKFIQTLAGAEDAEEPGE